MINWNGSDEVACIVRMVLRKWSGLTSSFYTRQRLPFATWLMIRAKRNMQSMIQIKSENLCWFLFWSLVNFHFSNAPFQTQTIANDNELINDLKPQPSNVHLWIATFFNSDSMWILESLDCRFFNWILYVFPIKLFAITADVVESHPWTDSNAF